jgi:hypothetical protein
MQNRHCTRKCATLAVFATFAQGGGKLSELAGGLGGDGGGGFFRAQFRRIGEHPFEQLALVGVGQIIDADFARLVRVAGEGGVDDDALTVAHDEQRRVLQFQRVVGELLERGVEIAPGLLVFPAEVAALPHVGPAVAAARLLRAALEAVVVRVARLVHAKQLAQVVEMRLRAGAFGERVVLPGGDEVFGGHA